MRFVLMGLGILLANSVVFAQDVPNPQTQASQMVVPQQSMPLIVLAMQRATHPETFLLSTYKMAKAEPVYESWAKISPNVTNAKDVDKDNALRNEMMRIKVNYDTLDTGKPLVIQVPLNFADSYSDSQQALVLKEFNSRTYFKYNMYNEHVAVIPKDIAKFSNLAIDRLLLDQVRQKTGGSMNLLAEILVRPDRGDITQPFVDNNTPFYLLLGEIAELRVWAAANDGPILIWRTQADWYKPRDNSMLMDLKAGITP